MFYREMSRG